MNNFLDRSWFLTSVVAGVVFLAFSIMVQSWMLAITTLIFVGVEILIRRVLELREENKAKQTIQALQRGESLEQGEKVIKVKLPLDLLALVLFVIVAFIELAIIVLTSF